MEFSLHTYINKIKSLGAPLDYIEAIRRNAQPLVVNKVPVLLTLGQLAYVTNVSYKYLLSIVKREIDPYRTFAISKRSGGKRFICVPDPSLLAVQRWLHKEILCSSKSLSCLSSHVTAYRPESSHIKNASQHLAADWLLKLDITNYFESISERQVYHVFRSLGYRSFMAFCLARLCTRILLNQRDVRFYRKIKRWMPGKIRRQLPTHVTGHLPQGAPTSPMLANLVCMSLDSEIHKVASRESLVYTRYADDITLSGNMMDRIAVESLKSEISKIIGKFGFGINFQKTNIAKKGGRKIVTGLSVEDNVLRLPRVYKDTLRKELYFIEKYGLEDHCKRIGQKNHLTYILRLAGKIRYASMIESEIGKHFMDKFIQLFPQFDKLEKLIL